MCLLLDTMVDVASGGICLVCKGCQNKVQAALDSEVPCLPKDLRIAHVAVPPPSFAAATSRAWRSASTSIEALLIVRWECI